MIIAKFTMDEDRHQASLHVNGHAGQNKVGMDIVCASASILAYTLAQTLKMENEQGHLKYDPTLKLKEGDSIITCRAKDEESYAQVLHSFLVIQNGYILLAHNYPQYVAVEMFGEDN